MDKILRTSLPVAIALISAYLPAGLAEVRTAPAQMIRQAIDNSLRIPLRGGTHRLALPQFDQGAASPDTREESVQLLLKRSPAQQQELDLLVARQQDPKATEYHQWLSPEEFGTRFGTHPSDINTVVEWLKTFGFRIDDIPAGRGLIQFSGTVRQIESAFQTSIRKYQVGGRAHFANSTDPTIPEALAPVVQGIVSLHDFHSHPGTQVIERAAVLPLYTSTPGSYYYLAPYDFFTIYNELPLLNAATPIDGTGQSIAIVSRSNISKSDVNAFRSMFLPSYSQKLFTVTLAGSQDPGTVPGDDVEAALDVEWAGATAPNANINMVVGTSTNSADGADVSASYIVNHNMAPVMSMSFGLCEGDLGNSGNAFYANLWQQAAAEGITVLVSSGDSGSAGCESADSSGSARNPTLARSGLNINGLASTPFNIAVGGTQFNDAGSYSTYWNSSNGAQFQSAKSYIPASVWNESCSPSVCGAANASLWSGGGGASLVYAKPAWQSGVTGIPNDNARDIPDVSLSAAGHDGYYVYLGGYYLVVSGTSASSPAFAGLMALANQQAGSRLGLANGVLYSMASARTGSLAQCNGSSAQLPDVSCVFYDITAGSNAVPCAGATASCSSSISGTNGALNGYGAGTGYDLATGMGAVNVTNLVTNWIVAPPAVTSVSPAAGGANTQTFGFTFSDPRGWHDLGVLNVLINRGLDGRNACYIAYDTASSTLYLVNDAGNGLLRGLTLGGSGNVSNSQCTIQSAGSSAASSGNSLTLTLSMTFSSNFGGSKVIYAAARDSAQRTAGWQSSGVWQVPGQANSSTVAVTGVSPNHGAAHSQTFTFTFSDTSGWTDLGIVNVLINKYLDGRNACYLAYSQPAHVLYLVSDNGSSLSNGLTLNSTGSISNSQCTVSSQGSSAAGSGLSLTLSLNVTFKIPFAGGRIVYAAARDASQTNNSDWQAIASWTVQ